MFKRAFSRLLVLTIALSVILLGGIAAYAMSPTDIALSNSIVDEDSASGTVVGNLSSEGFANPEDCSFELFDVEKYPNNASFVIEGNVLKTNGVFDFETKSSYSIRVRAWEGADSCEKQFTILINDVNEKPIAQDQTLDVTEDTSQPGAVTAADVDGDPLTYGLVQDAAKGHVVLEADGNYTYTSAANAYGDDSFTFKANDGSLDSNTAKVSIHISNVQDAPAITEDTSSVTLDEDKRDFSFTLHATDVDGDSLSWGIAGAASNGTAAVTATGVVSYVPNVDFNGTDSFTVSVSDGNGGTDSIIVEVTVKAVNDPPVNTVLPSVSGTLHNGQTLNATTGEWNDLLDGNPGVLSYSYQWQRADSAEGAGASNIGGAIDSSYLLTAADNGKYIGVKVTCTDAGSPGNQTAFACSPWQGVTNIGPVITEDTATITLDEDKTDFSFKLYATDADGDIITWSISSNATHGDATVSGTGIEQTITFVPDANFNGTDSFTVSISDGCGGTDNIIVNVTVNAVDDPPRNTAAPSVSGRLHNGQTISSTTGTWNDALDGNGPETLSFTYQWQRANAADGTGSSDIDGATSSTYLLTSEDNGKYIRAIVNCTEAGTPVTAGAVANSAWNRVVNTAPTFTEGTTTPMSLLEDSTGQALILHASDTDGDVITWSMGNDPTHGEATVSAGNVNYVPTADFYGTDSFTVTVSDGNGGVTSITVNVTVTAVNDAPAFTKGDDQSVLEDCGTQTISGWAKDISKGPTNESGQALNFVVSGNNSALFSVQPAISADGALTYTPANNANGTATVTVYLHDDGGITNGGVNASAEQTFTITITAKNDVPSFTKGSDLTVSEDAVAQTAASWATNLFRGPLDEASQALTFTVTNSNNALFSAQPTIDPSTGNLTYTPAPDANGSATVTVVLKDDGGTDNGGADTSAAQTFTIAVTAVNDAPVITDIADFATDEDTPASRTFIISDVDNSVGTLTLSYETSDTALLPKANIALSGDSNERTITVTPAANRSGVVTVTLTVRDSAGLFATQSFTMTVNPVNDAPTIGQIANRTIDEDTSTGLIGIVVNDIDTAVDSLTVSAISSNLDLIDAGCLVLGGSGANRTITLTPKENQSGTAIITVTVSDGSLTASVSFTVTVTPVNDKPIISSVADTTIDEDHSTAALTFTVSDIDNAADTLTVTVSVDNTSMIPQANIVLAGTGENRTITLTPVANKFGVAQVTISVKDPGGLIATNTFVLTVQSVNDVPTLSAIPAAQTTNEDIAKDIPVTVSDIEDAAGSLTLSATSTNATLVPIENITFSGSASRTIHIVPAANLSGTTNITITLTDSGGLTATQSFSLTVNAVNDAPSFVKGSNQVVLEDCGPQAIPGWATDILAGPADEVGQTVTFSATNDNNSLFKDQPTVLMDGSLAFTPADNANGTATVSVKLSDNGGGSSTSDAQTFIITITPVNDAPVAEAMTIGINTDEDQSLKGALRATDIEKNPLTYILVANGTLGSATIIGQSTGAFTYVPAPNINGTDTFTFKVNDGQLDSLTVTVKVIITGVNDPPVVVGETIATNEDSSVSGNLIGSDIDSPVLTFSISSSPDKGVVSLNSNTGAYTYTPSGGFSGTDHFTFRASDGFLFSNIAMVNIVVTGVNDAPVAQDETIYLDQGQVLHGVLKAADIEGDALTYLIVSEPSSGNLKLDNAATGVYTYTPGPSFKGTVSFTFKAKDGSEDSQVKTVTIVVSAINNRPSITDLPPVTFAAVEDTTLAANVSASDPDGDALTYSIVSTTSHGTLTLSNPANGTFSYVPNGNFNGLDRFTYKATDGKLFTSIRLATINVAPVNDPPIAYNQYYDTTIKSSVSGTLVAYDPDGDALTYSPSGAPLGGSVVINADGHFTYTAADTAGAGSFSFVATDSLGLASNVATVIIHINGEGGGASFGISGLSDQTIPEDTVATANFTLAGFDTASVAVTSSNQSLLKNGNIAISGAYQLRLTPELHRWGKTVITVSVTGTKGGEPVQDIATFVLTVTQVNHQPLAADKTLDMDEYTQLNEFVTGSDPNGDSLRFTVDQVPKSGTLDFEADGTFIYTPADNYYGNNSFTFIAIDSHDNSSSPATVTINIRRVDRAPVATSDTISTDEDTPKNGNFIGSDSNGGAVTFEIVSDGKLGHASITNAATGAFTYMPDPNQNGTDVVTFKVKGASGLYSGVATITITINPVNDAPVVVVKPLATDEEQVLIGFMQATDVENDPLTFELVNPAPTKGSITLNSSTGEFTYTPKLNEYGMDYFWVKVKDGTVYSETQKITIEIANVNDAPIARDTAISVDEDDQVSGSLVALMSDLDAEDPHFFSLVQGGARGTVTVDADGSYTYTPAANVNGIDYFSYRVCDRAVAGLYSNIAIVTVTINPINDSPTITAPIVWQIDEDSSNSQFNFTIGDIEDAVATLSVNSLSGNLPLVPADHITFGGSGADRWMKVTPTRHMTGDVVISITVTDSGHDGTLSGPPLSTTVHVTVTVQAVNDKPTINGQEQDGSAIHDAVTIDEDTSTEPIPFTINDEESGTDLTITATSSNASLVLPGGIVFVGSGSNRTVTVTPAANQNGSTRITIYVKDNLGATRNAYLDVTVRPVNDAPVVQPPADQTINEDGATETLYYQISDIDSDVETITMTATSLDPSKVLSGNIVLAGNGAERTVKVTPVANANGDVAIQLIANDHGAVNPIGIGTFTLHITPVNDAPTIGVIANQTIDEDSATDEIAFAVNDIDSTVSTLNVTAISGNTSLINAGGIAFGKGAGDGDRWIKLTPLANANGSALITVTVSDGSKTARVSFTLTVNPINDAPTINAIADQTILEDSSTSVITFTVGDIDNDVTQLTVTKESSDTSVIPTANIVLVGNGAERTVKVTPLANQNGPIVITLTVTDPGHLSASEQFIVDVLPVNDVPSFTKGANQTVNEDCGTQTVTKWATNINKGQPNEDTQKLTFNITTSNDALFAAGGKPAIDPVTGDLTYTLAADANGPATTVTITLKDDGGTQNGGVDTAAAQTFTITVTAVNDAPSFTKGADLTVLEDSAAQSVTSWATAISKGPANESSQVLTFNVTNNNNALFSAQPSIAANGTLTYTPATNANGLATVTVKLSDNGGITNGGVNTSADQTFTITVTAVNDAPSFTPGNSLTVLEDATPQTQAGWATAISRGPSDESGQVLTFTVTNDNNGLFTAQPLIDPATGTLTYAPAADANGTATVTVILSDNGGTLNYGVDKTVAKTFVITVTAVNDTPSFVKGDNQIVLEDSGAQSVASWATTISKGSANESGQVLTFNVTNNNNALFSAQPSVDPSTGNLTFTPAANANGLATVTVKLSDNGGGTNTSAAQTFTITVTPVNDAPSFTKGSDLTVLEDAAAQTQAGWATAISKGPLDEAGQVLTFTVTNDNNGLFSAQPSIDPGTGTLTYTPAADANGTATVTIILSDNGGTLNNGVDKAVAKTFVITVTAVNDLPSFVKGDNQIVLEDSGAQSVASWATTISRGPANESSQVLTFNVTNNNNALFSAQPSVDPSTGNLTFTPTANANGLATVTVKLSDNGGGANMSAAQTFTITVTPVNDAPSFTKGSDLTVLEDAAAQTKVGWATAILSGPADESGQKLTFVVTNTNNALFSAQPSIDPATGTLTYTPAANANGVATVTIILSDDGGKANGGADTASTQEFVITVTAVNDAPTLTLGANQTVKEDSGLSEIADFATGITPGGGSDESTQTLTFTVTNDNNGLFSVQPTIAADGKLSYTPAPDANGSTTVTVTLTDSGDGTNAIQKTFTINVTAVNDVPFFAEGGDQTVLEDAVAQSLVWATTISKGAANESVQTLTFTVTNNNNALFSAQPSIAVDGTLTYTPAANANGTATVTVVLSDNGGTANSGVDTAATVTFAINVTAVNDVPSFTKGGDQTVLEDAVAQSVAWATAITKGPANEAGQTLTFTVANNNNALFSVQPSIAANGTLTYTPAANANGTATVTVVLSDNGGTANSGVDTAATVTFAINVTAVNDVPSFTKGGDQTVLEDAVAQSVAWATAISKGPENEAGQTLAFTVTNNNNALFSVQPSIAANGTLTYTPAANANGTATVTVVLSDNGGTENSGVDTAATVSFAINVTAVNDVPSFTKGGDQTVLEGAAAQTVANWATAIKPGGGTDEATQGLTFAVTNNNNALFSVQPAIAANGTLTYTPAANANGTATVTVVLSDNGGTANSGVDTAATVTFAINVTAVNDVPSFTKGGDQTVLEDAETQTVANWATAIKPGGGADEATQGLTFAVTNNNHALFSVQPSIAADGTLTYTPATNANGTATVTVVLSDNGGTANSGVDTAATVTFAINVTAVNDVPSFTKGGDQTVLEDAETQTVTNWATVIKPGGGTDEATQVLVFAVTNNNNAIFTMQPSVAANGTLTYTPAANANGTATVAIVLSDNGGTANSGVDTAATETFSITVTAVNDVPSFTKGGDQTVLEDALAQSVAWATAISKGPANESGQKLTFTVTNNNNGLFSQQPSIDPSTGTLTYTPTANANGTATVTIILSDDGGKANGGMDTASTQEFVIMVTAVNDVPSFIQGADQTVLEDAVAQTIENWATAISKGPADESEQTLTFTVTNNNRGLFSTEPSIDPSTGTLTYTPAANANGTATVTVILSDDGGIANGGRDTSVAQTFTITVTAVNDEPTLTLGANQTVNEDSGLHTVADYATEVTTGGGADESGQTLTFTIINDNNDLFSAGGQPSIAGDGTLTYTVTPDVSGTANVTVTLTDSGDGKNSIQRTFIITVDPVNDVPSFTKGPDKTVGENTGAKNYLAWATSLGKGPVDEDVQNLDFVVDNNNHSLFAVQPAISSSGTLTFTLKDESFGTAQVTVAIHDNGGTERGGVDTSASQTFTITVVASDEMVIQGTIRNADPAVVPVEISGATVRLLDLSGKELKTTTSGVDGGYKFTGLVAGHYIVEVTHPSYSANSRMTEVSFDRNEAGVITEDFLLADFTLRLTADPSSILGDGADKSLLTAVIQDKHGLPIKGVVLTFHAEAGSFTGGVKTTTLTTDDKGQATLYFISEDLSGVNALNIPVTVTVNDPIRKLYGSDCIFVTFAPGFVEGIVRDGSNQNAPVEGATVRVYKDFDRDGITDFSFTQTTGPDGKYRIAIPIGKVSYDIQITKPVHVGDTVQFITVHQEVVAGEITGAGAEKFESENTATGIVVLQETDGSATIAKAAALSDIRLQILDSKNNSGSITIDPVTGVFSARGLDVNTPYTVLVKYDLGGGREIIAGTTTITITSTGEMNISEVLIDPYGTITERGSGKLLSKVKVELYYYASGALVPLPGLVGFEPSDNANPQYSDVNGKYAFMVFPDTDYYVVARLAGYYDYVSPKISVGKSIVKHDIVMDVVEDDAPPKPPVIVKPPQTEVDMALNLELDAQECYEGNTITVNISYLNKSKVAADGVQIVVQLPAHLSVLAAGDATIVGDKVTWIIGKVPAAAVGSVTMQLKVNTLDASPITANLIGEISGAYQPVNPADDRAVTSILLVTNRFGIGSHQHYIAGYPDGTFKPANSITRAEIAAIFTRIGNLQYLIKGDKLFADVKAKHWAAGVIEAAVKAGVFHSYPDGGFHPDQGITRAELAVVICNYLGLAQSVPIELHFTDISTHWARNAIEALYRNKIIEDLPNRAFRPNDKITRADAVTMINGLLKRGPLTVTTPKWPDVKLSNPYSGQIEESSRDHQFTYNADGSETAGEVKH